jgi:hypothetical protein
VVEKKVEEPKQDKVELKEVVEKKVEEPKQDKVQANRKSKSKQK